MNGVSGVVLNTKVLDMPRGVLVRIFESLAALEVSNLLGISRASSKESKRMSLVPDWSQTLRNVLDIHITGQFGLPQVSIRSSRVRSPIYAI